MSTGPAFGMEFLQRISRHSRIFGITPFHLKVNHLDTVRDELKQKPYEHAAGVNKSRLKDMIYII